MNTPFCVDFCLYFCTLSLAYVCGVFNLHIQTMHFCIIASRANQDSWVQFPVTANLFEIPNFPTVKPAKYQLDCLHTYPHSLYA